VLKFTTEATVCIDLTCVMAAPERQCDQRHGIPPGGCPGPTAILTAGVLLGLAANLAQPSLPRGARSLPTSPARPSWSPCPCSNATPPPSRPRPAAVPDGTSDVPGSGRLSRTNPDAALLRSARRADASHQHQPGQPITRDALRARLGIFNPARLRPVLPHPQPGKKVNVPRPVLPAVLPGAALAQPPPKAGARTTPVPATTT
jgi:hypothetical protein